MPNKMPMQDAHLFRNISPGLLLPKTTEMAMNNREGAEDLMNKSVSDLETLIDNFFNTPESDALTDATKNGYLVLPNLNPFLISLCSSTCGRLRDYRSCFSGRRIGLGHG